MIEARHLTKVFPDRKRQRLRAVDDVSFVCRPGEVYGLLGVNGAGKTTLLRLLATLLAPTSGAATVGGHDIRTAPARVRAGLGFLGTSTALYGRLTPRETITYFGRLSGLDDGSIVRRTAQLADELDLHEFLDRRVESLSTGMKQRTSIARVLVHDPAVIVFDEPTVGLDVLAARTVIRFVRECRDRGRTVVYSTHVMAEVEKLCDRIGIIHGGRLRAEGTVAELRARYGESDMEEIFVKAVEADAA